MTTHQVNPGTITETLAPKVEPTPPTPPTYNGPLTIDELVHGIADERLKQAAAMAVYNATSGRIVYIALGLAATIAATYRQSADVVPSYEDAIAALEDDELRSKSFQEAGRDAEDKRTLMSKLMRTRLDAASWIADLWPEFKGRGLDEELARTTEPQQVREQVVEDLHAWFEGEVRKEDIVTGLKQDAARDALANKQRFDLANIIMNEVDPADIGTSLSADDEKRLIQRVETTLKRFEADCLTGKARGFANSIERLSTATMSKAIRTKTIPAMLQHPKFTREDAKPQVTLSGAPVNLKSQATTEVRKLIAAEKS